MITHKKNRAGCKAAIKTLLVKKAPLALVIAAATLKGTAFADPIDFSQSYFIGDSLSDTGAMIATYGIFTPPDRGRFTTYPGGNWADYFAEHYGTSSQSVYTTSTTKAPTNYANANMDVSADPGTKDTARPNLGQEVTNLLDDTEARTGSRQLDPNAIYSVWAGPGQMVPILRGYSIDAAAGAAIQVNEIKRLQDAGARYILVPNTSNAGLSPGFKRFGWQEKATDTTAKWSKALYQGLNEAGVSYIPDDARGGLQEIIEHPDLFGIKNTTDPACGSLTYYAFACGPESFVTPDAAKTYTWSDWWHPTSGVHEMIARGIIANLEGPRLQQALPRAARATGRNRADQVARHVTYSDFDGWRLWSTLSGQRGHQQDENFYGAKTTPSGLLGLDYKQGNWVFGGFGGYGHLKSDFADDWGDFKEKDKTLGAFAGWYGQNLWGNLQVSYSWLDYDIDRKLNFGPRTVKYTGSPDGENLTVSAQGGYQWHFDNKISTGPIAALTWQKIGKDGYSESYEIGAHSYALDYKDDSVHSLAGRLGWQISYRGNWLEPYAELSYEHEFKDIDKKEASARLQTIPEAGFYRVPGLKERTDNYGNAVIGAKLTRGGIDLDFGLSGTFDSDDVQNTAVFLSLSKRL